MFPACYLIDLDGEVIGKVEDTFDLENTYRGLLYENFVNGPTVLMRRSCLDKTGLLDEGIFIPADGDLWLRLARRFRVGYVDMPLSKYRTGSSFTLGHIEHSLDECLYVLTKVWQSSAGISGRERRRLEARMHFKHAMAYRRVQDMDRARAALWVAGRRAPACLRYWVHLGMSFLSPDYWARMDRLRAAGNP